MTFEYFRIFLIFIFLILNVECAIDRVKNFRIERINNDVEVLTKRDENNGQSSNKESKFDSIAMKSNKPASVFPEEMIAHFEAFGKHFEMNLKRNDNLMSKNLKIETEGNENDTEDSSIGAAYNGVNLKIDTKDVTTKDTTSNNLFARFFATIKSDGEIFLQGGFEWDKAFFRLISSNHPSSNFHTTNNEISLLKRSANADYAKKRIDDDLIIMKESMDPKQQKSFGFPINSRTNSTFKCGHDDLSFNTDPRGVGNDFLHKINNGMDEKHNDIKINPLTAQYYLAKRSSGGDAKNEFGCPANRKVLYIGVAADSAYLAKFNGNRQAAVSNILTDFNLVSAIYEKSFNIELGVLSIILLGKKEGKKKNDAVPWDLPCLQGVSISERLNAFSSWRDGQSKDIGKQRWCENNY